MDFRRRFSIVRRVGFWNSFLLAVAIGAIVISFNMELNKFVNGFNVKMIVHNRRRFKMIQ